jgi:hypothetical protein
MDTSSFSTASIKLNPMPVRRTHRHPQFLPFLNLVAVLPISSPILPGSSLVPRIRNANKGCHGLPHSAEILIVWKRNRFR